MKQETFVDGVTQQGGADGDLLQVKQGERQRLKLKLDLVGALPLNDENYKFKTCAVVGNSGVLLKSKQGREIDEHEKVFRINYAPTAGYEEDVGSRTDFDFVNLQHVKPFIAGRTRLGAPFRKVLGPHYEIRRWFCLKFSTHLLVIITTHRY